MAEPQHENPAPDRECDDTPKLTADEWAYIQAAADVDQAPEGGDS